MSTTTEEMEQPAKQWQVEAVNVELKGVSKKIDTLLDGQKNYVTHAQLEDSLILSNQYTDGKIKVIETKYGPIYRLFWVLITAIVAEAGLLAFQLAKG